MDAKVANRVSEKLAQILMELNSERRVDAKVVTDASAPVMGIKAYWVGDIIRIDIREEK